MFDSHAARDLAVSYSAFLHHRNKGTDHTIAWAKLLIEDAMALGLDDTDLPLLREARQLVESPAEWMPGRAN